LIFIEISKYKKNKILSLLKYPESKLKQLALITYSKKNIHRWKFWRKKGKVAFCLASGLLYSIYMFIGSASVIFFTNKPENLIDRSGGIALVGFIAGSFLSIAHWYENERRYKDWLKNQTRSHDDTG